MGDHVLNVLRDDPLLVATREVDRELRNPRIPQLPEPRDMFSGLSDDAERLGDSVGDVVRVV